MSDGRTGASESPEESPVRRAIRRGGEWYLAQRNERFLNYVYDPDAHSWEPVHHPVRELAALWAIARLAHLLDDPRYRDLAEQGLGYFGKTLHHDAERDIAVLGITPQKVKISYNAFLILSLLEMARPEWQPLVDGLARGILYQQQPSGQLVTHFNGGINKGQDYYPGQSLLALMALYEASGGAGGGERYLRAVEKAFPYYRNYWRESPKRPFIPWQTQAYCRYHRARPNPDVAEFVFEMNDRLFGYLARPDSPEGFDFSSGIVIAVYIEGLNQAYRLALDYGDKVRALRYGTLVQRGAKAVMALQCPREGEAAESYRPEGLGGFLPRQDRREMRVDHNQHAIMALIGGCEVGLLS